jgi:hypothetical protein
MSESQTDATGRESDDPKPVEMQCLMKTLLMYAAKRLQLHVAGSHVFHQ